MTDTTLSIPMRITAHLTQGYATAHPWGIALDGLLASQLWAERLANTRDHQVLRPSETASPIDLPLPLAKCTLPEDPLLWHWAATCSQPVGDQRTEIHWRNHYFDHRHLDQLTRDPLPTSVRNGRHQPRHMPLIVTICGAVTWEAVGDPTAVLQILSPIAAIGKKRSHGEGSVTKWEVTRTDRPLWDTAHLHADRTLGRPTPTDCLPAAIRTTNRTLAGIRPPYMHPSRQAQLHIPTPNSFDDSAATRPSPGRLSPGGAQMMWNSSDD